MNEQIYLRPINLEDTENVVRWRNSEHVRKYFIYQADFTVESHVRWMKEKVETGEVAQFIIVESDSQRDIGSVFLRDIDWVHNKAEYGIFIGEESAKGKGYGTLAAKKILEYAFDNLKLHRIYLRVLADNQRAIVSYKKAGFVQEGVLKDDVLIRGEYKDVVWMAIINPNN